MTNRLITLSDETRAKAAKLLAIESTGSANRDIIERMSKDGVDFDLDKLLTYLEQKPCEEQKPCDRSKKLKSADAELHTMLLKDIETKLNEALSVEKQRKEIEQIKRSKFKLGLLAVAGALFFACEGFDGVSALLGLASASAAISLGVSLVFSFLSVIVFWGFGLRQIAEHLGVEFKDAPNLVNQYVTQMDEIEQLIETTKKLLIDDADIFKEQLESYNSLLTMLRLRLIHIQKEKFELDEATKKTHLKVLKTGLSLVTGVIFFSSGFFTGQAVALSIAGLFIATASATFPPILAAAVFVGLVALMIYWYLEKPGIENFVGRKLDLDDEKLKKLDTTRTTNALANVLALTAQVKDKKELQQGRLTITDSAANLEVKKEEVNQLSGEIAVTKDELQHERQAVTELTSKLQAKDGEATELSRNLDNEKRKTEALTAMVQAKESENEQLRQKLKEMEETQVKTATSAIKFSDGAQPAKGPNDQKTTEEVTLLRSIDSRKRSNSCSAVFFKSVENQPAVRVDCAANKDLEGVDVFSSEHEIDTRDLSTGVFF